MITMVRDKLDYGNKAARRLHALRMVQTTVVARRLAWLLFVALVISMLGMTLLPWQQSAKGTGRVVAFVPQERQQTVEAQTKGIISKIADGIVEGTRVQKDQLILEIAPQASNLVEQLNAQLKNYESKIEASQVEAELYANVVIGYTEAQNFAVSAAEDMVNATKAKLQAKIDLLEGYRAKELQARLNYERQARLNEKGVKATKEVEKAIKDYDVAVAEVASILREIETAEEEVSAKQNEVEEKRASSQTKIDSASATIQKALGEIETARKEMHSIEIKMSEADRLVIKAPRDGTIYRLDVYEGGQTVKEGEPLFTIVPDASEPAVELWVSGNDTPLVHVGDDVRLQFEGWPALQFTGWPAVAVGTFSGTVVAVDATDDGKGKFRVLVIPAKDAQWPAERYLRQGVRANGWVMLRQVPLGYEIWRQLNGFPPVIADGEPMTSGGMASDGEKAKKPKLPK